MTKENDNVEDTPDKNNPIPKKRHRLQPLTYDELGEFANLPMLIKRLLPSIATSIVYGESGTGKTFFALDLAFHIAHGVSWRENRVMQGAVIYIAAEAGMGIKNRLDALLQHFGLETLENIYIIPSGIDLGSDSSKDADILIYQIKELIEREQLEGVALVIIDTLARALAGGDENTPKDMGRFIQNSDRIKDTLLTHVMVVHHSGKDPNKGPRGHSSNYAAADTVIAITNPDKTTVTAEVEKQRDGEGDLTFHSKLEVIVIGQDEDGDNITSCILLPSDAPAIDTSKPRLSKQQRKVFDALLGYIADHGETRTVQPDHAPVLCVSVDDFKEALMDTGISQSKSPDDLRRAYARLIDQVCERGAAKVFDQFIWIPDETDKPGRTD